MSTHMSSKMDISSKKKLSTVTRKKSTKKFQTNKHKDAEASVTEKVNDLHSLEATTTHSKQSDESSKSSYCSSKNNAEHKCVLVETSRSAWSRIFSFSLNSHFSSSSCFSNLSSKDKSISNCRKPLLSKIKCPYVTLGQVSGLAALERWQVIEGGLEQSVVEEILNEKQIEEIEK